MAGKVNGVKTIILKKYPRAIFVHCASHCLNLSKLVTIRNTIDTIKTIIIFFRDSVIRREALMLKSFCETRWTEKYNSMSFFKQYNKYCGSSRGVFIKWEWRNKKKG